MSECKVYRREIDEAADGGGVSGGARAHASLCRACGDELRARESLRALVGGLGKVEAPADFEFRLRARMAASKSGGGRGLFSGTRWLYGFAPVAVAACFVVVSATLYFRQAARPTPAAAPAVAAARPSPNVEPDRAASVNVQSLPAVPAVEVKEVVRVNPPKTNRPAHKASARDVQAREVASAGGRRADVEPGTLVSSVTGAQVIKPISVKASAESLRVILRDERGAERVVPMRGVSFGSQDFLARGASARPSVAADVEGVW
jgi:hypothetical protein